MYFDSFIPKFPLGESMVFLSQSWSTVKTLFLPFMQIDIRKIPLVGIIKIMSFFGVALPASIPPAPRSLLKHLLPCLLVLLLWVNQEQPAYASWLENGGGGAWSQLNENKKPWASINLFRQGQCCGTVTIFHGSGSGSDFWQVSVPVPTFEKLPWYGSGSGSLSRPLKAQFQNFLGSMKEIKYTILYCVYDNFCDSILLRFRNRN